MFRLKHGQQEVKKKQAELKRTDASYKKDQEAHKTVQNNMNKHKVWHLSYLNTSLINVSVEKLFPISSEP